jgi:succinyl-CoA synthetase beta subunit
VLNKKIDGIIDKSKEIGWVLEPDAKEIFRVAGFDVPEYTLAETLKEALSFADKNGYPVVAKVVSPEILHKTDVGGVEVDIPGERDLEDIFKRFSEMDGFTGVLVEEMLEGIELIVGAKVDSQFGPIVLLGIGGVGVEIYQDTSLRMAPLQEDDVESMIEELLARDIIMGFRGSEPINRQKLTKLMIEFSELCLQLKDYMESIDLNPVMCNGKRCVIADARIILSQK